MSIISSFPLLSQEEIRSAKRLSALLASKSYGAANALHEIISGAPAPGGQALLYYPHDHCLRGVPLARASQYSYAKGNSSASWAATISLINTYHHFPRLGGLPVLSGEGEPDVLLYVTPGIDSDKTNITLVTPCALGAKLSIYASAGTTTVRFKNRTTDSESAGQSTSTTGSIVTLTYTDIPCRGGEWNEIDVEILTNTSGAQIRIVDLSIAETRSSSQPASDGSSTMTAATKP